MMLIQSYNKEWKQQFETIQSILQDQLQGLILGIEHVGSTSVPDLAAKPIIDMDIVYENDTVFPLIVEKLTPLGYYHNGNQGIPKREALRRKGAPPKHPILDNIRHHLYACPKDSPELKRHLAFRNFLRQHQWARAEYVAIKQDIALRTNQIQSDYALLKETVATPFIEKILRLADTTV